MAAPILRCSLKSFLANRRRKDDTFGAQTTLSGRHFHAFTTLFEKKIFSGINGRRLFKEFTMTVSLGQDAFQSSS